MRTLMIAALIALVPACGWAHAIVVAASPAVNAHVAPGALDIRLRFNSRIDVDRSRIVLRGPDGGERTVALSNDEPAGVLTGHAEGLTAGQWKLRWQVLSVDGHITRGEYAFRVGEGET